MPTRRPDEGNTDDDAVDSALRLAYRNAPPWLVSAVFHMLLLIVLALWLLPIREALVVDLKLDYADRLGDQLDDPSVMVGAPNPSDDAKQQIITPEELKPVDDPFAAPPKLDLLDGNQASGLAASIVGTPLAGREEGSKRLLLGAYGGNALSEAAVTEGLKWLTRQQRNDGAWSLMGPYRDGAATENIPAATAMALLAFQGAGNTHQHGQFKKEVAAGSQALLKLQDSEGNFFLDRGNEWLYTQAQCTIAICELYGMTKDETLREPAELAVKFCVEAQSDLGGWRYQPRNESDTSVTGWMVMALQSARMAGLAVPPETFERVGLFLDKVGRQDGSRYAYLPTTGPTLSMTAEGLLCRQYLGWKHDDPRLVEGAEYLAVNLPTLPDRDVYYWYYATQVMHHMEGDYWKRWNDVQRDLLVNSQEKATASRAGGSAPDGGFSAAPSDVPKALKKVKPNVAPDESKSSAQRLNPERGSWDPKGKHPDAWGVRDRGGRLYTTCLSLYMLEVYYRHLPIYSRLGQ